MLFVKSPYMMLHHPLFRLDSRRVRWAWSTQRLRHYTWGILVVVHLVVFVLWSFLLALYSLMEQSRGTFFVDSLIYDTGLDIIGFMMLVVIAAGSLLDLVSLQAAVKTINGEMLAGRWDLLRLTALNERGIVAAKHAGVRLRVWRFTSIVASARLATVVLWLFAAFIAPYLMTGDNVFVEDLLFGVQEEPVSIVVGVVIAGLTALIYVMEPFWRMQSMTALGMVLSAYIVNIPLATLAAMGTMLAVWLLQFFIAVALVFGLGFGSPIHRCCPVSSMCLLPALSPVPRSMAFMPFSRPGVCAAFATASSNPNRRLRPSGDMLEFGRWMTRRSACVSLLFCCCLWRFWPD